jgi:hypothetical protein
MNDPLRQLDEALAFDGEGRLRDPLAVLSLTREVLFSSYSTARESLRVRLFLETPLPYWHVARWAQHLGASQLAEVAAKADPSVWKSLASPTVEGLLTEVAQRFDNFDPDGFAWSMTDEAHVSARRKFLLGRELARSYVATAASGSQTTDRPGLLERESAAWEEWIALGTRLGLPPQATCEATALAHDHLVRLPYTFAVAGVGKAHILLEPQGIEEEPTAAVVTAELLPLGASHAHLDGAIVPDLRAMGTLALAGDFLDGVAAAWRYCRAFHPVPGPCLLVFAVRPAQARLVQRIAGRSAETAVLATIDSVFRDRVLRPNASASATLHIPPGLSRGDDVSVGVASFGRKKHSAARDANLAAVVVHPEVAKEWRRQQEQQGTTVPGPRVVPGELFRRDALPLLETRSLWKLAVWVPLAVAAAFVVLAGGWQLFKASASPPDQVTAVLAQSLPWAAPLLMGSEMLCLFLCAAVLAFCGQSIRVSLDSWRSAGVALAVSAVVVLVTQFAPVGVRYEGLLDNPYYSVLFGEPQVVARDVIAGGGGGMLALHAISQTLGFVTILYGVSALALRLLLARAFGEPIFEDRCQLVRSDWSFCVGLFHAFVAIVVTFGLVRNALFYYYLTTLPGVPLVVRSGVAEVVAPLVGIAMVLVLSVGFVWLVVVKGYLHRVALTAAGRMGYRPHDVVAGMPRFARWLYRAGPWQ